jgi:hypothetical protein
VTVQQRRRQQSQTARANARPTRVTEPTDVDDELTLSLIETFPASDPPAWIPLARVGIPKRPTKSRPSPKRSHRSKWIF